MLTSNDDNFDHNADCLRFAWVDEHGLKKRKYKGKLTLIYANFSVFVFSNPSVKRQEKDFEKSEPILIVKKLSSKRDLNWPGNESGPSGE